MFWSGETLLQKLPGLITPFSRDHIDCNSYTLTIGHEVYVSPSDQASDPKSKTKQQLKNGQAFTIPPGQFAFLLTEETVAVPSNAMAFISMKSTIKFKGLVNVSGFHVDPGFMGQLTFAVFNAGPTPVYLQQGQPCFLVWYAGLDCVSKMVKTGPVQAGLNPNNITGIAGEIQSLEGLANRIRKIEGDQRLILAFAVPIFAVILTALVATWLKSSSSPQAVVTPTTPSFIVSAPNPTPHQFIQPGKPPAGTRSP
jgi:dCTP deaminase